MAFILQNFQSDGNQAGRGKAPQRFKYRTADTLAQVTANNYFLSVQGMLEVGDIIELEFVDSATTPTKRGGVQIVEIVIKTSTLILALERNQGRRYLVTTLSNIATNASTATVTSNITGIVRSVRAVLGGPIAAGNPSIAFTIGATTIGGSPVTITAAGSALGTTFTQSFSSAVTAANGIGTGYLAAGDVITATNTSNAATGNFPLYIIIEVLTEVPRIHWESRRIPIAVTTASNEYIICPVQGSIIAMRAVISGDPGAAVTLTGAIRDTGAGTFTAVTTGVVTLANGGAAGNVYEAFPTATNTIQQNGVLRIAVSANSANAIVAYYQIAVISN